MYNSIKEWMTCPVTILPFLKYTASSDKEFGEPVDIMAYIAGNTEVLNDMSGTQVVSTSQIYYDASKYTIHPEDRIKIPSRGTEKDIISISEWYDGNTGTTDIGLVYL